MADAYVRLENSIVPSVYARYSFEEHVQKLELWGSGILYSDPVIAGKLQNGGRIIDLPGWKDLGNDPSEPVNDDPEDLIELKNISSRREAAARHVRAQAWGVMDLTSILAGSDPQKVLIQRQTDYWKRAHSLTLSKTILGVIADNVANDGADMVRDTNTTIAETDIIDAAYLMGDRADMFSVIWMHSKQMKVLKKADLIDFVPASQQSPLMLPYYQGLRVLVDDDVPKSGSEYTAIMFKPKAVHWEEMAVDTEGGPLEFKREPRAGHGGGMTEMTARRHFVMHPRGFRYLGASVADEFPTDAELALAANWDRTASSVKNVGFIALRTTES